jgi:hypothetical protein
VELDESRRRRTDTTIQIRKEKKDDQIQKRRAVSTHCIHTHILTYSHTHIPIYSHTDIPIYTLTYSSYPQPPHIHTYTHTQPPHIHTYTHTHTQMVTPDNQGIEVGKGGDATFSSSSLKVCYMFICCVLCLYVYMFICYMLYATSSSPSSLKVCYMLYTVLNPPYLY